MGLELDTLKNNDGVAVIYNNTNGNIMEFYGGNDFIKVLGYHKISKEEILKYFTEEEIINFFDDLDMDLEELEEVIEFEKKWLSKEK